MELKSKTYLWLLQEMVMKTKETLVQVEGKKCPLSYPHNMCICCSEKVQMSFLSSGKVLGFSSLLIR